MTANQLEIPARVSGEVFTKLGVGPGSVIDGKFRVESAVGVGGMSMVLEATHLMLEETVALKCLDPNWAGSQLVCERFSREARSVAKLKSDHIAKVYDVGKLPNGLPYIVMEFLRGEDLGGVLERGEAVELRTLAGWMIEACEGLAEAHALGIVHRDVKPENLFVVRRSDGRRAIKLLDFGISKQLLTRGSELDQASLSRTLELVGTPLYMSPEQVRLSRELDHRTDIWSLGAVFYEMLSGEPPFMGEGVTDLCARILEQEPRPPSQLARSTPPELDRVVLKCLEKDAARRYPSVAELASDLLPFAHPRYHAQVDRIIRTLHSAGLTDLQLSSVPPPALAEMKRMLSLPAQDSVPNFAPGEQTTSQSGVLTRTSELSTLPAPRPKLPWLLGAVVLAALLAIGTFVAYSRLQAPAGAASMPPLPAPVPAPTELQPVATAADPTETATASAPPPVETSAHAAPGAALRPPRAASKPAPVAAPAPTPPSVAPAPKPGLDIELSR